MNKSCPNVKILCPSFVRKVRKSWRGTRKMYKKMKWVIGFRYCIIMQWCNNRISWRYNRSIMMKSVLLSQNWRPKVQCTKVCRLKMNKKWIWFWEISRLRYCQSFLECGKEWTNLLKTLKELRKWEKTLHNLTFLRNMTLRPARYFSNPNFCPKITPLSAATQWLRVKTFIKMHNFCSKRN